MLKSLGASLVFEVHSENRARQAGTFLGMTDPRLDFVPADLMAPGEMGPRRLSAVFLFWARSFGMNGCTSADVILFLLPHSESSVWFLIQIFWRHSLPASLQPVLIAIRVGGSEPPP